MRKFLALFALTILVMPLDAVADPGTKVGFRGWGPRVGMTFNPDQIHFGAHLDFGNFAQHVRLQPNIEVGFGDDITVASVNLEIAYRFHDRWNSWTPFVGAGPAFVYYRVDSDGADDSESDVGLNILAGIDRGLSNGSRFFLESTLGIGDIPDFKLTAGWTFFN